MTTDRRNFKAPWSRALMLFSMLGCVALMLPAVLASVITRMPAPAKLAMVMIFPVVVGGCALYTVRGYRVEQGGLHVKRLLWSTTIYLDGLRSVEVLTPDRLRLGTSMKVFGNGGLFSFSGLFWNKELGRFHAYITDYDRVVLLTFPDRKVVVSPDDPQAFVALLNR